jgi:hypothetical protein
MMPLNPHFWDLWKDVDGLNKWDFDSFFTPGNLFAPTYVPLVRNGSRRIAFLENDVVALPFSKVVGFRKGRSSYGPRFSDGDELRRFFKVRPDARVILVGVREDRYLENLWQKHRNQTLFDELVPLNLAGVTVPNFSAFDDMSQFNIFWNMKRMLIVAERLSASNIPVILHLNATNAGHWKHWAMVLKEHSEVRAVCKEFQTGFKPFEKGMEVVDNLSRLQDETGNRLHPILVGGGPFYRAAKKRFDSFTVIDSRPHMLSMGRTLLQVLSERFYEEVKVPTLLGQGVDDLYRENLRVHFDNMRSGRRNRSPRNDSCQMELDFSSSIPYLTAQSAA